MDLYKYFAQGVIVNLAHLVVAGVFAFAAGIWFSVESKMTCSVGKLISVAILGLTILSLTSSTVLLPTELMLYLFALGAFGGNNLIKRE